MMAPRCLSLHQKSARHERDRVASVALPEGYKDVWICPILGVHLQPTAPRLRSQEQGLRVPERRSLEFLTIN